MRINRKLLKLTGSLLVLLAFLSLLLPGRSRGAAEERGIRSSGQRAAYLRELGWETEAEPLRQESIRLPEEFPPVLENYNKLQLSQGFDLRPYAGKEIEVYTYRLRENGELSYCSLYQYRSRIIGGDVHSPALSGGMRGILPTENG